MSNLERTDLANEQFKAITSQAHTEAVQEALVIFEEHIADMPLDEAETALNGLREYALAVLYERDIVQGWVRNET